MNYKHNAVENQITVGKKTVTLVTETPYMSPEDRTEAAIRASVKIREIMERYPQGN